MVCEFINNADFNLARDKQQVLYISNALPDIITWDEAFDYFTKVVNENSIIKTPGRFFTLVTHTAHLHIDRVGAVCDQLTNLKNRQYMNMPVEGHMYKGLTAMSESFGPHSDDCEVVFWQCLGQTQWTVDDSVYTLSPGDCIYVPRGITHDVKSLSPRMGISFGF